jgi:hypothetical protein
MMDHVVSQERKVSANAALEAAAVRIEDMLHGLDPWISGEVLAIHNAIRACAAIVRNEKRA